MKRPLIFRIVIALILCIAIAAIIILPRLSFNTEGKPEQKKSRSTPVHVQVISPSELQENLSITGTVLPFKEVDLTSETSGRITKITMEEDEFVEEGDLLVKLNDGPLQAQLQQAQHQKALLEKQLNRKTQLLEKEGISQESYDQTKTDLESTKAEIQQIREQIEQTEIRAPFDGIVGLKYVEVGSYISASTQVARIRQMNPVKLDFSIPGKYAHLVEKGQQIEFRTEGADSIRTAEIYAIEPGIDQSTRTLPIRAVYPNKANKLIPGQFVTIDLTLTTTDQALMIPAKALVPELGGQKLYLYRNGQSHSKGVEIGKRTADQVQVTQGLNAGDTVITQGIQSVGDGTPVKVKAWE